MDEPKLFLVISNNRRNAALPQVLAARLTTTRKQPMPSIVQLGHPEVFTGCVVCDDIIEVYQDEVVGLIGALTPHAMRAVNRALLAALGITG